MPRITLIHAVTHSIAPINTQMERLWPEATRTNLLDDSLSVDLARVKRGFDETMFTRFRELADYAKSTGTNGILFTCSAFGPYVDAVAKHLAPMPVLKPNEAMIADAVALLKKPGTTGYQGKLGLMSTFDLALESMPAEFPAGFPLLPQMVDGALHALNQGDTATHDHLIANAARQLAQRGCTALALAQFSMARAKDVAQNASGLPVLTTPASAVAMLRRRLSSPTAK
ncbi:MAG: aspartate/glutamate racemase family protein [Lautropia sp.]|nr:aspartate/glutamate racemase family protein [Lautropia sp.]